MQQDHSTAVSIIHSAVPGVKIAINPGTSTTPAMRDLADVVVTAENYFYDQLSGWSGYVVRLHVLDLAAAVAATERR